MDLLRHLDPRLSETLRADLERRRGERVDALPRGVTVVLAGHRAAGKSSLLPHVARWLDRQAFDLDTELEQRSGRALAAWIADDEPSFRQAERDTFATLPRGAVVAVGGGFLASHAEVLRGCVVVLVPVTFETYVDRLRADTTRPRLKPGLSLDDELREVFFDRDEKHRIARPLPFVDFLLRGDRGVRARRVVTLPPGEEAWRFAWRAKHDGADLLEVRTDLTPREMELRPVARALPLLVAHRGGGVPAEWRRLADLVDEPLGTEASTLLSFHASGPLTTRAAVAQWSELAPGPFIKHVEPLGGLSDAPRLFETQAALIERFGAHRVTVLATGPLALPYRAVLAKRNALDYLALDAAWRAAEGQRFCADATREFRWPPRSRRGAGPSAVLGAACPPAPPAPASSAPASSAPASSAPASSAPASSAPASSAPGAPAASPAPAPERLGILGASIAHARSPRIHAQPFDRLDLPRDTDVAALLSALHPHYRGLAVTAPFKQAAALAAGASRRAVNTLVRTAAGWNAFNTDVDGAAAVLDALGAKKVTALGDGGATDALREAATSVGVTLEVRVHRSAWDAPLSGAVVWTWPPDVEPPPGLRFDGATVAVIAYGPPGRRVSERILALGGTPRRVGHRWFVAQARRQRALWEPNA